MSNEKQTQTELLEEIRALLKVEIPQRSPRSQNISPEAKRAVRVKELAQAFSYATSTSEFKKDVLDYLQMIHSSQTEIVDKLGWIESEIRNLEIVDSQEQSE